MNVFFPTSVAFRLVWGSSITMQLQNRLVLQQNQPNFWLVTAIWFSERSKLHFYPNNEFILLNCCREMVAETDLEKMLDQILVCLNLCGRLISFKLLWFYVDHLQLYRRQGCVTKVLWKNVVQATHLSSKRFPWLWTSDDFKTYSNFFCCFSFSSLTLS
jgi:hypothetical protein